MQLIKDGYDKIATIYLANRVRLKTDKYLRKFLQYLPKGSSVLDLGCGAGVPVDDILLKAGHSVMGMDISPVQIKLARKSCPGGEYFVGDINKLTEGEYEVGGIVAMYSFFHVKRTSQLELLKKCVGYLPAGGVMLITFGDRSFEGVHQMYGTQMWSSQYSTKENRVMMERAGLEILLDELDTTGGERHQILMGKKR